MKTKLIGATLQRHAVVTSDLAINFIPAPVLATPNLIWGLEFAARDAILPLLEPGQDSVGSRIDIAHLAATPVGMEVTFKATVVGVEGRSISFACEAFDEVEKIAEGTHERIVIDVVKFASKAERKAKLSRKEDAE